MKQLWNVLRYLVIIALDIFFMLTFHSYVNLLILIGLILFPVYSIVGLYRVCEQIRLSVKLPMEPMKKGEEFVVYFEIQNPTFFPLLNATIPVMMENKFYSQYGEHTMNMPVRARGITKVQYPIVMDYCGRFVVSADKIILEDLLGFLKKKVSVSVQGECLIFPEGEALCKEAGAIYLQGVTEAMESKEKGYDFSEITGIREYIPGDKLQNIHWKLSTKKDELMVKERVSVSAQQLNVLVELVNDDSMCMEGILNLVHGVTKGLVVQNLPFTLFYYSTNLRQLKDVYIGNEIERVQCIEGILYDHTYGNGNKVEEEFLLNYAGAGSYLYIGVGGRDSDDGLSISGDNGATAKLVMM